VKLLNDLYGGSATADRNVYVESATYNGSAVSGSYQYVNGSDAKSFTVADSTAAPSASTPTPTPTGSCKNKGGRTNDGLNLQSDRN
jgi:hypothetical protein